MIRITTTAVTIASFYRDFTREVVRGVRLGWAISHHNVTAVAQ